MTKMDPTEAEGVVLPRRSPNWRKSGLALGHATHLGRALGRGRTGAGEGVRQVIVGRELTWRPALSGTGYDRLEVEPRPNPLSSGSGRERRTSLYNAGGSPAIGARYVYRMTNRGWILSLPVDVPAHGVEAEVVRGQPISEDMAHTVLASIGARELLAGAIFCRDFLNRSWCFPIPDSEESALLEAIVWRKGSRAPVWASSAELWRPQL